MFNSSYVRIGILASLLLGLIKLEGNCQMVQKFAQLPLAEWSGEWRSSDLTDQEKLERLSLLPQGDSVQFELPDYDPENDYGDPRYFPFNIYGLHYFDLDFDGDLDMIYSGQSGWQTLRDTKVYLLENDSYELHSTLRGGLLDIQRKDNAFEIHTMWVPCCDSYTTRIETHSFSAKQQSVFKESISIIALKFLKGMPDFTNLPIGSITDANLYASRDDFRGTHPYFRDDNRPMNEALRKGEPVSLINLQGQTKFRLMDQKTINDQIWYLVITEPVLNAPKSHYEWSDGDHRRFVGWVKNVKMD